MAYRRVHATPPSGTLSLCFLLSNRTFSSCSAFSCAKCRQRLSPPRTHRPTHLCATLALRTPEFRPRLDSRRQASELRRRLRSREGRAARTVDLGFLDRTALRAGHRGTVGEGPRESS